MLLQPKKSFLNLSYVCALSLSCWGKGQDTKTDVSVYNIIQFHTLKDLKTQEKFYFTKCLTQTFLLESAR